MKRERLIVGLGFVLVIMTLYGRTVRLTEEIRGFIQGHTFRVELVGKDEWRMTSYSSVKAIDDPTFIRTSGLQFKNGTLVIRVLNWPGPTQGELLFKSELVFQKRSLPGSPGVGFAFIVSW
jgi:hypothetical protein